MSDLGSLSRCTLESDLESSARAKRLRGKSLAISLGIEAAVIAVLLLMPLLAPGVLPPMFEVTPSPPYRGQPQPIRHSSPPIRAHETTGISVPINDRPVFRPTIGRNNEAPPPVGTIIDYGSPTAGPGIPSGFDRSAPIILAPPPTARRGQPLVQSEGVMAARLVRRIQPDYPEIAKLMRLSGLVHLRAIIGTDGSVQQLEVLSGNPILARAAVLAVREWRYEPTRLNGRPVEVETSITVTFVLN